MVDPGPDQEQHSTAIPSDGSLLRRFRSGQQDAAGDLYDRYAGRLEALARAKASAALAVRFDPEDVVQSVFRTFFRRVADGQYEIPPGEELWGLFLVISLNKIRKLAAYHRAARRDVQHTATAEKLDNVVANPSAARHADAYQVLRIVIDELLETLSPSQRAIVELRIEGQDVAEISRRTQRAKRTVERVLQEFRKQLQAKIDG